MASRFFGLNRGQNQFDIVEGSSTGGKDIEAVVDLAIGMKKSEVILALERIKNKVIKGNWPPAVSTTDYFGFGTDRGDHDKDVVAESPAFASGTITCASVLEGDTVTIDGTVLTAQDLREKFTVLCVADSSGSLNNTYFDFNTPSTGYRVWINVNSAGSAPSAGGRTLVEVAVATDAANTAVASAVNTAIDALAGVSSTVASATVTVVADAIGSATDAAQGAVSTGFTITVTRQGAASPGTAKFAMNTSDAATATSLAAAINAEATISTKVTAAASTIILAEVVTITAIEAGTVPNAYTLATNNGTRLAKSDTTILGGLEAATGEDVRLTVEMEKSWTKSEVVVKIDQIRDRILQTNWPPA